MNTTPRAYHRSTAFWSVVGIVTLACLLTLALIANYVFPRTSRHYVQRRVPAAAALFDVRGEFVSTAAGFESTRPEKHARQVFAKLPRNAAGQWTMGAIGRGVRAELRLLGAAPAPGKLQNGAVTFPDVWPHVDVVALDDPSYVELLFVAQERPSEQLGFEFAGQDVQVRIEPSTGAVLVAGSTGSSLRIERPLAVDSTGATRTGSYRLDGRRVSLSMPWEELKPPIVVDPKFSLPMWVIVDDSRVPAIRQRRDDDSWKEAWLTHDTARDRTVLVRPSRNQQLEDTVFLFGDLSRAYHEGTGYLTDSIAENIRDPFGMPWGARELEEWRRGYALESETWEWDGHSWVLVSGAMLPGLMDPSLAFDERRGKTVLFGGAMPGLHCSDAHDNHATCSNWEWTERVFEYNGANWQDRWIPGAPPQRIRASMTWDSARQQVLLFGGRALDQRSPDHFGQDTNYVSAYGKPFPETVARDLLNDTWTYDGDHWIRIPTGNPPPPREGARLVQDPAAWRQLHSPLNDNYISPSIG